MKIIKFIMSATLLLLIGQINIAQASFFSNLVKTLPTPPPAVVEPPPEPTPEDTLVVADQPAPGELELFNTGLGGVGGAMDPHYDLTQSADASTTAFIANIPDMMMLNGPDSRWISSNMGQTSAVGTYQYQLTFDLSGYFPETAFITGRWAASQNGMDIEINGMSTGQTTMKTFSNFTIDSGFVEGMNTLDFIIENNNTLNLAALRVEFTDSGATLIPLPPAVWLFGSGLAGLWGIARRRRKDVR